MCVHVHSCSVHVPVQGMSVCGTQVFFVCICATCVCLHVCAWLFLCVCVGVCVRGIEGGGQLCGCDQCGNMHRSDVVSWVVGQGREGGVERKGREGRRRREIREGRKEA